jgi:uncharacterized protein with NRDE domain
MCLIVFSYLEYADYPLIFAGNRDEFHGRPAAPAHFWGTHPDLLAGRDLQAGGTWLGVSREGLFATVTNYREPIKNSTTSRLSRGALVTEYLLKSTSVESHFADLAPRSVDYNGFNLIFGRPDALYYFSNRGPKAESNQPNESAADGDAFAVDDDASATDDDASAADADASAADADAYANPRIHTIEPGLHGLSNEQLDTPWPKVRRAKELFRRAVDGVEPAFEPLLDLLADSRRASDHEVPSTGLGPELESRLSSIFIPGDDYGTRASTVVLMREDGLVQFAERTYGPGGVETGTRMFDYVVDGPV